MFVFKWVDVDHVELINKVDDRPHAGWDIIAWDVHAAGSVDEALAYVVAAINHDRDDDGKPPYDITWTANHVHPLMYTGTHEGREVLWVDIDPLEKVTV